MDHDDISASAEGASNKETSSGRRWQPRAILRDLEQVEHREQEWIWKGWIPRGAVSMGAGDPGVGKTLMALDLASTKAAGGIWPDGSVAEPGPVLYIDGENGEAELKRRLVGQEFNAWGDFRLLSDVDAGGRPVPFSLTTHLPALEDAIASFGPEWIIVDPLVAFHSKDENKATEVRELLSSLGRLAERHDLGITLLHHPNKSLMAQGIYRVRGSIDFVAAVRAMFRVELLNDQVTRLLRMEKLNLGAMPASLAFQIRGDGWVDWLGEHGSPQPKSQRARASDLLLLLLAQNAIPVTSLTEVAEDEGISWRTFERAKRDLGVISLKQGPDGPWFWGLPSLNGAATKS